MSIGQKRRESDFFRAISEIISHQLSNANISPCTVTNVQLSKDSRYLNVYVTFENNLHRSLQALDNAKGFIRKQLASYVNARIVPELNFKVDDSFEKGQRIEQILKKIKNQ